MQLEILFHNYNMEIDHDKILRFNLQGFIRREWNWPTSCLNDSETQERGL